MASKEKQAGWMLEAKFCRKMAEQSGSLDKRVLWLSLANKWLALTGSAPVHDEDENVVYATEYWAAKRKQSA